MIGEPLSDGAVSDADKDPAPAVTDMLVGALGAVGSGSGGVSSCGVIGPNTVDHGPMPTPFTAATRIQCGTAARPVSMAVVEFICPST